MIELSRQHLRDAGESYLEHMRFALTVGLLALGAGAACLLHALVPALCQRTCSRTIAELQRLFADRCDLPRVQSDCEGVFGFVGLAAVAGATAWLAILSTGGTAAGIIVAALALAFPATYLATNPELQPDAADDGTSVVHANNRIKSAP